MPQEKDFQALSSSWYISIWTGELCYETTHHVYFEMEMPWNMWISHVKMWIWKWSWPMWGHHPIRNSTFQHLLLGRGLYSIAVRTEGACTTYLHLPFLSAALTTPKIISGWFGGPLLNLVSCMDISGRQNYQKLNRGIWFKSTLREGRTIQF